MRFQAALFVLATSGYAFAQDDPAPENPRGVWLDDGLQPSFVAAYYNNEPGEFAVYRSTSVDPTVVSLSLGSVLDIDRFRLGATRDIFILCGGNIAAGTGFVTAIEENAGVFSTPTVLWSGQGRPTSVQYSPLLGELLVLDETLPVVRWASFTPTTLATGTWGTMAITTTGVPDATSFSMSAFDISALNHTLAVIDCDSARGTRIELTLSGAGTFTQTSGTPAQGSDFGICQNVVVEDGKVSGFGPPGAVLEAFSVVTNTTLGVAVAASDGFVEIPVSGVSIGDHVSVRDLVSGLGTGATRKAYSVVGSGIAGPSGLTPLPFGANAAGTLTADDANFRILCLADAPASAPAQYPAIAVLGLPTNIVQHPELGFIMVGAEVITFPAGMQRAGTSVRGYANVPIPASAVGLTICLQWMALDGSNVVSSNIACMSVQASN